MSGAHGIRLALLAAVLTAGCQATGSAGTGVRDGRLAPCPASANCVSSQATDARHRVAPLPFSGPAEAAMERVAAIVRALPRTRVVAAADGYLHAECRSALFGFVDDLEFLADEEAGVVHLRSAARLGTSDLGVNRRRVHTIRGRWTAPAP